MCLVMDQTDHERDILGVVLVVSGQEALHPLFPDISSPTRIVVLELLELEDHCQTSSGWERDRCVPIFNIGANRLNAFSGFRMGLCPAHFVKKGAIQTGFFAVWEQMIAKGCGDFGLGKVGITGIWKIRPQPLPCRLHEPYRVPEIRVWKTLEPILG
uniref:Uncharacterized protein n=1 Tax=mine drainage metagenome TaxID=410659 RepID=E6PKQ7_9ZZZZ